MSQDLRLLAFRKRARLRGYREISLKRVSDKYYRCSFIEPVSGARLVFGVTAERLDHIWKKRIK